MVPQIQRLSCSCAIATWVSAVRPSNPTKALTKPQQGNPNREMHQKRGPLPPALPHAYKLHTRSRQRSAGAKCGTAAADSALLHPEFARPTRRAPQSPVLPACTVIRLCTRTARCDGDAGRSAEVKQGQRQVRRVACRGPKHRQACMLLRGVQRRTSHDTTRHECRQCVHGARTSDCGSVCVDTMAVRGPLRCAAHRSSQACRSRSAGPTLQSSHTATQSTQPPKTAGQVLTCLLLPEKTLAGARAKLPRSMHSQTQQTQDRSRRVGDRAWRKADNPRTSRQQTTPMLSNSRDKWAQV